jgi:hypothetical protein
MNMNGVLSTVPSASVFFGRLLFDPSEPIASQYGGFDRSITVEMEQYGQQKVWYRVGGLSDRLRQGDVVMLEYAKNKWRLSKQQTPELLKALESRGTMAPQPMGLAPAPRQANTDEDIQAIADIFTKLRRYLPASTSDEAVVRLACTVFNQRNR